MPVSLKTIRSTGSLVLLHTCETCGAAATFGIEVSLRLALIAIGDGDKTKAKRYLGKWYCREHRPKAGEPAA